MLQAAVKISLTVLMVVAVAEISKRDIRAAALLASIPMTSVLALAWMHHDGQDPEALATFSRDLVWLIVPSCALFITFPMLIERGWPPLPAMGLGLLSTVLCYLLTLFVRGLEPFQ